LFVLFVFIGIVVLAYFSTKWIARARNAVSGGNIKTVESVSVGVGANVCLVRVGGEYFLLGVTKERVSLITAIDPESIAEAKAAGAQSFERVLSEFKGRLFGSRPNKGNGDAP